MINNLPSLKFNYSRIYNTVFNNYIGGKDQILDYKEVLKTKDELEEYWEKNGKAILRSISKVSGLKWRTKDINVYINSCCPVFSNPLTLSLTTLNNNKRNIETDLIHELIHVILTDNHGLDGSLTSWINEKYGKEDQITKIHIKVHAIQTGVFLNLKMEKDLLSIVEKSKDERYKRAWEIVKKEGWENIVQRIIP